MIGASLVSVGIVLFYLGSTLRLSSCWGHLGCDYYQRTINLVGWLGLLLGAVGAVAFFEALLNTKAAIVSKIVLALGVLLWAFVLVLLQSSVFVF